MSMATRNTETHPVSPWISIPCTVTGLIVAPHILVGVLCGRVLGYNMEQSLTILSWGLL